MRLIDMAKDQLEQGISKQITKVEHLMEYSEEYSISFVNVEYLGFFRFSYSPEYSIRCSTERIYIYDFMRSC